MRSPGILLRRPRRPALGTLLVLSAFAMPARADDDSAPPAAPASLAVPALDAEARAWLDSDGSAAFGRWLKARLADDPNPPEWLSMFADILKGSQLGPRDGWFVTAVAKTRYNWDALRARYDSDGDGSIAREEFPGADADFRHLDRSGDGAITAPDLAWPEHALAISPGAMLYYQADRDGDGRVTTEEFQSFFERADSDGRGFLSLDDLRTVLPMPTMQPPGGVANAQRGSTPPASSGPSKATLVQGLFRQEIGSLQPGPDVGQPAPDFQLRTADGDRTVTLSEHLGSKPIVLVFGNITCGPFRTQAGNVQKLYERYRDRAHFLMLYVREAHPTDGWHMSSNDQYGVTLTQPATDAERQQVAQTCQRKLGFDMPFLVDSIADRVGAAYSGMPSRLYVIAPDGTVAYKSGRGPFGFKPGEMEQSLIWALLDHKQAEKQ